MNDVDCESPTCAACSLRAAATWSKLRTCSDTQWGQYNKTWQKVIKIKRHYIQSGHFIRYTLLVLAFLQNCVHSLWHRFKKVLDTFLRDFKWSAVTNEAKVYQKISQKSFRYQHQSELLVQGRMDPCLYACLDYVHMPKYAEVIGSYDIAAEKVYLIKWH